MNESRKFSDSQWGKYRNTERQKYSYLFKYKCSDVDVLVDENLDKSADTERKC